MTPLRRFSIAVTIALAIATAAVPAQQGTLTRSTALGASAGRYPIVFVKGK